MTVIRRNFVAVERRQNEILAEKKKATIAWINEVCGNARLPFITDLPGQDMIYQRKETEARSYLSLSPEPASLTGYPLLAAEVGITAQTAYQLAQLWINMADQLSSVAAFLERARMEMINRVTSATSIEDLKTIKEDLQVRLQTLLTT